MLCHMCHQMTRPQLTRSTLFSIIVKHTLEKENTPLHLLFAFKRLDVLTNLKLECKWKSPS